MSAASQQVHAPGFSPAPARVEPPAVCASARAGGHLAQGASAPAAPCVLSDADIVRLRHEGETWETIARRIGRCIKTAQNRAKRAGYMSAPSRKPAPEPVIAFNAGKPVTDAMIDRITAMRAAGKTWRDVAIAEGRTLEAIRVIRNTYGLSTRFQWTTQNTARLVILLREGTRYARIAETLGCGETSIITRVRWLRQNHPKLLPGKV